MASGLNSLTGRLLIQVLAVHAVLLPAVFFSLFVVAEQGERTIFVDHARASARIIADLFEVSGSMDSEARTSAFLDSAVLSGSGLFAEIQDGSRRITSSVSAELPATTFVEDFAFGQNHDEVYYLSVPLHIAGHDAVLRLGFDEAPTNEQIAIGRNAGLLVLGLYLLASLGLVAILGVRLAKPVRQLKEYAKEVAAGRHDVHLYASSGPSEIAELARALDIMREHLVAKNFELSNEILERQTAEKQKDLLEQQLHHVQRLESIGTLAGGMAHEFNNILQPIILFAEIASDDLPSDHPSRARLARIIELVTQAKGMIGEILTFSRRTGPGRRELVSVALAVEEAVTLVRALVPATIEIGVDVRDRDAPVICNTAQIQQLVINLCTNGYQAIGSNTGCLRIGLESVHLGNTDPAEPPHLRAGYYVRIRIADNGEGMTGAELERIFEPFYTTREVGKGTGLGLSVAHGIAVGHGGEITVQSEPGRGSVFDVYLPRAAAPPRVAGEPEFVGQNVHD